MTPSGACPDPRQLERYAAGRLDAGESGAVAGHVRACAGCADTVRRLQAVAVGASPDTPTMAAPSFAFLSPPQDESEIGRFAGYIVRRLLGQGGMGMVFEAEDPHLKRPVALKVLLPTLACEAGHRQRFLREARAAAALHSDHVVRIYQAGEDNGVPFLAMELLRGEPLDRWLKRGKLATVSQALRLGAEVALGLAAAHERGLIHRDVKPANVWLESPRGRVKLLDFGLARAATDEMHVTQTGLVMGTPAYMSPEQARGEPLDGRTDLFSLGCVLYEVLGRRQPFQGPTATAVLSALLTAEPTPLAQLNDEVPPALDDLIRALLAKSRDDRPRSAEAVAAVLRQIEAGYSGGPIPGPTPARGSSAAPSETGGGVATRKQTIGQTVLDDNDGEARVRSGKRSGKRKARRKDPSRFSHPAVIATALLCATALGASAMFYFRPGPPAFPGGPPPGMEGGPPQGPPGGPNGRHRPPKVGDLWQPGEPTPPGWPPGKPMPAGWRHGDPLPFDKLPPPDNDAPPPERP